jgi:lipoyl(octanoyl) transferase
MDRRFESFYLSEVPYSVALEWQRQEADRVRKTNVGRVIGLEHPSVITLGKRGSEKDLKFSLDEITESGIEIQNIDRGGEATLHSPGQLVVYPLIPLSVWELGVREYVDGLKYVTKIVLRSFGIRTYEKSESEPGLYSDNGKIAFFGIRVERGVTSHGVAINVRNDLSLFQNIVSCGVRNERFDSFNHHDVNATPLEVFERWSAEFKHHFLRTQKLTHKNLFDRPS